MSHKLWNERESRFAGKIEEQACEIERLHAVLERMDRELMERRDNAIEECARVAETYPEWAVGDRAAKIAAAIRALKDKR